MNPDEPNFNQYFNYASTWYIDVHSRYFRREIGKDWAVINETDLPKDLIWSPMPAKMYDAFKDGLPK